MFLCCFRSWQVHFFWTNFVNRGAGFISLENLLFFAKTFSVRFWVTLGDTISILDSQINNTPHHERVFAQLLPKTDLFANALVSLYMLQTSFQRLLKRQGGKEAVWEYPFAVAGVNITFMIMQMLDLDASTWSKHFEPRCSSWLDIVTLTQLVTRVLWPKSPRKLN